ncbi:MAG: sensor histidine kinase [Thermoleophilia bacterium]
MSHELRAPIGAITLAAAGLRRATGEIERDRLLDGLLTETLRLEKILESLLDVSLLQTGELRARRVVCLPERLLADAIAASGAAVHVAHVETTVEPGCPQVLADPFLTERILVNLLQNAVRHGAPPVRLNAAPRGRSVDLVVSDAGPGIDPGRARLLFRSFVDSSATGGLGVGLRLSHCLARAQGAELRRVGVPSGACFVLRIPSVLSDRANTRRRPRTKRARPAEGRDGAEPGATTSAVAGRPDIHLARRCDRVCAGKDEALRSDAEVPSAELSSGDPDRMDVRVTPTAGFAITTTGLGVGP